MRCRAIFFDRDGTLTYGDPERIRWRDETVQSWSGKPFSLPYEKMIALFRLASEDKKPWYRNIEDERAFFLRYYRHLLFGEGITEDIDDRAAMLRKRLWCAGEKFPYPETESVLQYFYKQGYKMGVISNTSPSLRLTLEQAGIAKYFISFMASSLVGASKPDPGIFNAALLAQGVTASESLFVDDAQENAEGARERGFTSFRIDRTGGQEGPWTTHTLSEMVAFAEKSGACTDCM